MPFECSVCHSVPLTTAQIRCRLVNSSCTAYSCRTHGTQPEPELATALRSVVSSRARRCLVPRCVVSHACLFLGAKVTSTQTADLSSSSCTCTHRPACSGSAESAERVKVYRKKLVGESSVNFLNTREPALTSRTWSRMRSTDSARAHVGPGDRSAISELFAAALPAVGSRNGGKTRRT